MENAHSCPRGERHAIALEQILADNRRARGGLEGGEALMRCGECDQVFSVCIE